MDCQRPDDEIDPLAHELLNGTFSVTHEQIEALNDPAEGQALADALMLRRTALLNDMHDEKANDLGQRDTEFILEARAAVATTAGLHQLLLRKTAELRKAARASENERRERLFATVVRELDPHLCREAWAEVDRRMQGADSAGPGHQGEPLVPDWVAAI